jgi:hypothetical protein
MKIANEALKLFTDALDSNAVLATSIAKTSTGNQMPIISLNILISPALLDRDKKDADLR